MYRRRRYKRNRTSRSKADWKGIFGKNGQTFPNELYTTVYQLMASGESWDVHGAPGNIFCNQGDRMQRDLTTASTGLGPHAIGCNSPIGECSFTRAVSLGSQNWRTPTVPLNNINQWAPRYQYCTVYGCNIVLEIGNIYTLDAGFNPYGNGEDGMYLYYCLPNVRTPPNSWVDAVNPWAINAQTSKVTDVIRTVGIRRVKLRFPNTTGNENTTKIRIAWRLKDIAGVEGNYMESSVSSTTGVTWTVPSERDGFTDASNNRRHMFYFWMGSDNLTSNFNFQARWKASIYYKIKLWQPRFGIIAPVMGFQFRTQEMIDNPPEEEQEEGHTSSDQMDFETSVPSTPIIEQLAQELKQLNAPKKRTV